MNSNINWMKAVKGMKRSALDDDEFFNRRMTRSAYKQMKMSSSELDFANGRVTRIAFKQQQQQKRGEVRGQKKQQHQKVGGQKKPVKERRSRSGLRYRPFTKEEEAAYKKKVKESEGFDVGKISKDIVMMGLIRPLPLKIFRDERKEVRDIPIVALKNYNDREKTSYKFVKLVRVTCRKVAGMQFLITFQAKDDKAGSPPVNFQTSVYDQSWLGITEIKFVRLEPNLKVAEVSKEGLTIEKSTKLWAFKNS